MSEHINLEQSWKELLSDEFEKSYFTSLKSFLISEQKDGKRIYPRGSQIFAAFDSTPVPRVKAVIIGQDPYHGAGQANGLCFSVNKGVPIPPSLQNIFKELETDIGIKRPSSGDLSKWAAQGVLMLNATLTVREGEPGSHQQKGWEQFTDKAILNVANAQSHLVFLLWGKYAQSKASLIDKNKHLILYAPHPSPFSAHSGFLGCKHFSKANTWLESKGKQPIDWELD